MTKVETSEVRKLSDEEITKKVNELRKELFQLRFDLATRQLSKTHRFKQARVELAQLLTIQNERKSSKND